MMFLHDKDESQCLKGSCPYSQMLILFILVFVYTSFHASQRYKICRNRLLLTIFTNIYSRKRPCKTLSLLIIWKACQFFAKWHKMAIYLNIQLCKMCNFKTETADKVLKQSTWNQLQEQLQELSFQERYHTFLLDLPLDRLLWQTKGCQAWYLVFKV